MYSALSSAPDLGASCPIGQETAQFETMVSNFCQFSVQFWGVRGRIPTPGRETVQYGGNTVCIEVQVGGKRLIFDGGTGLRVLGEQLLADMPVSGHLFFTHTHWERIQGFPFFIPAFLAGNRFDIYGALGENGASIKQQLSDQMLRPNFPVPLQSMRAQLQFHDITPGAVIQLDEVSVETVALHQSNQGLGYRVNWGGQSIVYATNTQTSGSIDPGLLYLAHEADLLIFDAAALEQPYYYRKHKAAHSKAAAELWHYGVRAAIEAEVKQAIMCRYEPNHDDEFLAQLEAEAQKQFPHFKLAHEGLQLSLE